MRQILGQLIADFQERHLPDLTPRSARLSEIANKIEVVIGMRRSGKTFFLFQQMKKLLESGLPKDRILYANLEDDRLLPIDASTLADLLEAFYETFPHNRGRQCWLFLDEVHNVAGWERVVRRFLDTEELRIVLSGSSARLLGREIATSLRGRSVTTEILPFSFAEVLSHRDVQIPSRWPPSSRVRSRLEHELGNYLEIGGFPELQGNELERRIRILQDYIDVVLFRDVVERHRISNTAALRYLVRRLVGSPGSAFSINRFYHDLKSQGLPISKDTLHEYLVHLEDALLIHPVHIDTRSERTRMRNPRRFYLADHALSQTVSYAATSDLGRVLENIVYLHLRRSGHHLTYIQTAEGHQVDFLAIRPGVKPLPVQVCVDLSDPSTRLRELRALEEVMRDRSLDRGIIVSLSSDETVSFDPGEVRIVPAWRWLLE